MIISPHHLSHLQSHFTPFQLQTINEIEGVALCPSLKSDLKALEEGPRATIPPEHYLSPDQRS